MSSYHGAMTPPSIPSPGRIIQTHTVDYFGCLLSKKQDFFVIVLSFTIFRFSDRETEGVWKNFYTNQIVDTSIGMVGVKEVVQS